MNAPLLTIEPSRAAAVETGAAFIGIDNGITGAMACLTPEGGVLCEPVIFQDLGREKLMDVDRNLALLERMIAATGLPKQRLIVVFEQSQIFPKVGARNNYTNGRHNEFWRVLLTMAKIPFTWVNPQIWQRAVFSGIRGDDTKEMADLVRRQRFPNLNLDDHTRIQIGGINDAVCIALWARQTLK
jgi:hypothetical protein